MTNATAASLADRAAYLEAIAQAVSASAAYYKDGTSPLDDAAFDALMSDIAAYEAAHPEDVSANSPMGKVAAGALAPGDVAHASPMLSLDNVFDPEGLAAWAAGLGRRLARQEVAYHAAPKIDGAAVSAHYVDGKLTRLVTRGDGVTGEDVSHAIGTIDGLPDTLSTQMTIEVRGEVVLTTAQFDDANRIRAEHREPAFSNPRNAAAGTLRATGRAYVIPLSFYAYSLLPLGTDHPTTTGVLTGMTHTQLMQALADLGVRTVANTPAGAITAWSIDDVAAYVDTVAQQRAALPLGIDGIVVKADDPRDQAAAGTSSRAPRWAIAYKLSAIEKNTRLVDVTWATGRTGNIAPRATLEPVDIDGVTVTFASLHNPRMIADLDLRLGDMVVVRRAGDVIPQVVSAVAAARTGSEVPIPIPSSCPNCDGPLDTSQERWRCLKGRACALPRSIEYAVGRDQLDIEGLGSTIVARLVEQGAVTDVADLFALDQAQLLAATGSEKNADKILHKIAEVRRQPLSRVLCALGVRGTGRSMSRRLARHFGDMVALQGADAAALQQVEGIGPEKTALIVAELDELANVIAKLRLLGVNLTEPAAGQDQAAESSARPLDSMTVVATGTMTGPLAELSRNEVNERIEAAGGKAASSVSKRTSLVVAGDGAGSKKTRAQGLGVRVVTPEEFAEMLGQLL